MLETIVLIISLLVGGVVVWVFLLPLRLKTVEVINQELRLQTEKKELELKEVRTELDKERQLRATLEESQKNLQEQVRFLENAEKRLKEAFESIALNVTTQSTQQVVNLATKELEGKKELIDQSIETIAKTLSEVHKKISDVEKGSSEVSAVVKHHSEITSRLRDTAENIREVLANPAKRGEWGERMAEDIINLVGMKEGINYAKQKKVEGFSNRPDFTFFLPNNLKINMDAKFPHDNYTYYLNSASERDREHYKKELLKNARQRIKEVTTRDYINQNTVDYVIVFIPTESVFNFINETDTNIMDDALRQKVVLCSPFTLYAVLSVIRQAVENFNLERTTSEILKLLGDFYKQWDKYKEVFRAMGDSLDSARKKYDELLTTRTNMLEKPLNKIEEMRKQKAITFEETIEPDETSLLQ